MPAAQFVNPWLWSHTCQLPRLKMSHLSFAVQGSCLLPKVLSPPAETRPPPVRTGPASASGGDPSLISWDDLEAARDVYSPVVLPDGRAALVRSPSGKPGAPEVVLLGHPSPPEVRTCCTFDKQVKCLEDCL